MTPAAPFLRGIAWAVVLSVPLWALIALAAYVIGGLL